MFSISFMFILPFIIYLLISGIIELKNLNYTARTLLINNPNIDITKVEICISSHALCKIISSILLSLYILLTYINLQSSSYIISTKALFLIALSILFIVNLKTYITIYKA